MLSGELRPCCPIQGATSLLCLQTSAAADVNSSSNNRNIRASNQSHQPVSINEAYEFNVDVKLKYFYYIPSSMCSELNYTRGGGHAVTYEH